VGDVQSRLDDATDAPAVFHEIDTKYFSAGSGTFIGDLYGMLGADNIADATGEAYPQMSAEAIIQADPDVIVLADEDAGESPETVKARPGWGSVSAVKNDRIP
jgi:iron complex transport system substrate-binding protein